MTIILEEKFNVGTDVYGDFIRRYHESIIRRLDKFHSGIGIVGPANLTRDSRWSTVSVTNLSGRTIEIAKCLESLWVFGYRCGPSHPWGLVTESAEKDFSSLPGRHTYLDFDGNYSNVISALDMSRSSLDNAITVLDIYAKAFDENRKPNNTIEAQRCFIILVIYFAEALRIVPIRDLLQKKIELYEPNVLIDGVNMDLARNWDKISLGFLSGSYSKLERFGIHNEVALKQKLWLIYNRKTPLHELDGVRPNGWLGDPGNGGDAGAPKGKSGRRGHLGDGGPSSGANQGDSKNRAGGGQSRDQVAGRGSRLPKGKRCSIELFNKLLIKIQFGMVIEYLFEQFPNWEDVGNQAIGDLQEFYKASKKRFDDDASFKERAQQAVVKLQGGEAKYRAAWQKICEISRSEFDLVYKRLNVYLEERGESFYNPYIPDTINVLTDKGLVEESDGARVIFLEGFNIPLIIVKSDGGYNYASTDLTALKLVFLKSLDLSISPLLNPEKLELMLNFAIKPKVPATGGAGRMDNLFN